MAGAQSERIEIEVEEKISSNGNTYYCLKLGALGIINLWPAHEFNGKLQPVRAYQHPGKIGWRTTKTDGPVKSAPPERAVVPLSRGRPFDDPIPDFTA